MRHVVASIAALALIAPSLASAKGRPQPITCPSDVAAAMAETCPCDGKLLPTGDVQPWKNHGQFVSCVVRFRNALRRAGCLTSEEKRTLARCAAKSTCGKSTTVLCCTAELDTCAGDPVPGDQTAAGTCSNDPARACDVDADCTTMTASMTKDADGCTAAGGTVTSGSVCSGCSMP